MIKLSDVTITKEQVTKNGKMMLVEVSLNTLYEQGKSTGKTDGYKYTVVLVGNRYERITVKVPVESAVITQEELDKSTDEVFVDFTNFEGKFYQSNTGIGFSATAEKCVLVTKKVGVLSDK